MSVKYPLFWLFVILILVASCADKHPSPPDVEQPIYDIQITTIPDSANVYVSDDYKGISPLTVQMTLDKILEVRAKKDKFESTGEQIIKFGEENTAELKVLLAEVSEKRFAGSDSKFEKVEECKTARTVAKAQYGPEIDYSNIGSIYFDFDKSKLRPESITVIEKLIHHIYAAHKSGMIIAIEGHTDATGDNDYNLELSQKRVEAVVDYLTTHEMFPIPKESLWINGYGENCPLATNKTQKGRSINRRTDIILLPTSAIDKLPENN